MTLERTLEEKLVEINRSLDIHSKDYGNIGLLGGLSGVVLFKFYYAQYKNDQRYAEEAYEFINECFEKCRSSKVLLTYCDGAAGFGWVLDHLVQNDLLDADNDVLLSGLDDFLYEQMSKDIDNQDFDYLHGAMGHAFYFLNRYKNTSNIDLKKKYSEYLHHFIDKVIESSVKDENGHRTWLSIIDPKTGEKVYNFSLSHGVTSILGFFIRLSEHPEFYEKCVPVMKEVITYLESLENKDFMCYYPSYMYTNGKIVKESRVAWCYGDLGIAVQFWHASHILKDDALKDKAIAILRKTTERKTSEETMMVDASICHGSFGVAQIFLKAFKELKDPLFKKATDYWIQDGLDRAFHEDGLAGYKQVQTTGWENEISLLEGISGIGLVIIDYLSEETHTWDECFMIS